MMGLPGTNQTELSPLDQIRQTEAEVTRQIAAARKSAEQTVAQARKQARAVVNEAQKMGHHEGQTRFNDIILQAEELAQTIIAHAQNQAEDLRRNGLRKMSSAVHQALEIIIGNLDKMAGGISDER